MFCEKCGSELQDDWKICPNCGEPVPEEKEENITEQSREVPTDNKTESTEHFGDSTTQSTYVSDNKKNSKGIINWCSSSFDCNRCSSFLSIWEKG